MKKEHKYPIGTKVKHDHATAESPNHIGFVIDSQWVYGAMILATDEQYFSSYQVQFRDFTMGVTDKYIDQFLISTPKVDLMDVSRSHRLLLMNYMETYFQCIPTQIDWAYLMAVIEKIRQEPGIEVVLNGDISYIRKRKNEKIRIEGFKNIEIITSGSLRSAYHAVILYLEWKLNRE